MTKRNPMIGIRKSITHFEKAAQELVYLGSYPPDEWDGIRIRYDQSRKRLETLIERHLKGSSL